jgi:hypothetical protein
MLTKKEVKLLKEEIQFFNLVQKTFLHNTAKVFPAIEKLNYNYSLQLEAVTMVMTCSGRRYSFLLNTLKSFFTQNTYPIKEIIVIDDDVINEEFNTTKQMFPNITWISTNMKVGQLFAIDIAYKFITTEFYFHCEEDW